MKKDTKHSYSEIPDSQLAKTDEALALFRRLRTSDSSTIAKNVGEDNPPTPEQLKSLKAEDDYKSSKFIDKHIGKIKVRGLYLTATIIGVAAFIFGLCIILMVVQHLYNIGISPEKLNSFLESVITVTLTVFSTLFLNYVFTKKTQ